MRASAIAPAHMAQGSSVTHRSQPSSREVPSVAAAARSATISAWAVGSLPSRMRLRLTAIGSPSRMTTAPTGTSPASAAARASARARRIGSGSGKLTASARTAANRERRRRGLLRVGLLVVLDADARHLDFPILHLDHRQLDVGRGRADLDVARLDGHAAVAATVEVDDAHGDQADADQDYQDEQEEEGAEHGDLVFGWRASRLKRQDGLLVAAPQRFRRLASG